jgi:hypothetical protein
MSHIYVDVVRGVSVWYYRAALLQEMFLGGAAKSPVGAASCTSTSSSASASLSSSSLAVPGDLDGHLRYGKACIVAALPRVLRLCANCCLAAGNDLSPLAALLTCALRMPRGVCADYPSKCIEVGSLISALDWIRSVVNTFCGELGAAEHVKLIERVNQMVEVEHLVHEKMQLFPDFVRERLAASGTKLRPPPKATPSTSASSSISRLSAETQQQHQQQSRDEDEDAEAAAAKAVLIPISVIERLVDQLTLPLRPHVVQVLGYGSGSGRGKGAVDLSAAATASLVQLAAKRLLCTCRS